MLHQVVGSSIETGIVIASAAFEQSVCRTALLHLSCDGKWKVEHWKCSIGMDGKSDDRWLDHSEDAARRLRAMIGLQAEVWRRGLEAGRLSGQGRRHCPGSPS